MYLLILVAPAVIIPLTSVIWAGRVHRSRQETMRAERMRDASGRA
jgi:hypothetical protein